LEITENLLNDPDESITTDVNAGFNDYAKELIKYFDMKAMEGGRPKKYGSGEEHDDDDGDILFSNMDYMPVPSSSSYWSKERVVRR